MLVRGLAAAVVALALSLPVALGATHVAPGQRVDLKVLLISADGTEPGYGAWKAALEREGVPYDALVATTAPPLTDAQLADYGAAHARYQAVIVASGDLGHAVANPNGTTSYHQLTPAQPVCSTIILAASGVVTSPLPMTGMDRAA